jgi:hypothetical protein
VLQDYSYFELHRSSDGLVYQFDRKLKSNDEIAYRRRDQDLWITYRAELGWVAWDEASQTIMGKPWNVLPNSQIVDHPPEGEWVSKKGAKSYVYQLKYLPKPIESKQ